MPRLGFSSLLFLVWIPTRIRACLQCDTEFKSNIAKLRTDVVPKQMRDTRLKARAEALLRGLEGDFFLHYATSQFSGLAVKAMVDALLQEVKVTTEKLLLTKSTDEDLLENLVEFRRKTTMKLKKALKKHQIEGCDEKICGSLTYEVINCKRCLPARAYCLSLSQCFVDNQDRLALRFGEPLVDPDIARTGVAIVLCMGGVLFLVIMGAIIVYWRSQLYRYV
ncbi:izumo sperm-egg fusion protein 2 [Pseudonaja textilis]|uniref:izumo sperm-egg fusion protein 2 n=1 Tax=Pseudonaja textilis TaxID=8673 RepID=UPI000EA97877|nr:izumo sperm-egg fusion protein 2 [Pseudonaja textilis]